MSNKNFIFLKFLAISILSGIVLASSFLYFPYLLFLGFIPLFWLSQKMVKRWQIFLIWWLSGTIFFAGIFAGISHLAVFIGNWAYLVVFLLSLFQGLFWGIFGLFSQIKKNRFLIYFALPAFWVVLEWLRSLGAWGVSFGDLGYAFWETPSMIQTASLFSVYFLSYLVIAINLAIFGLAFEFFAYKKINWWLLSKIIIFLVFNLGFGFWELEKIFDFQSLKASLIQPNITQMDKMDYAKVEEIQEKTLAQSQEALKENPSLLAWPETITPEEVLEDEDFLTEIENLLAGNQAHLLTGSFIEEEDEFYNGALLFSPQGELIDQYRKTHLVPFGEYFPGREIFAKLVKSIEYLEDLSPWPELKTLEFESVRFGPLICFESSYPALSRKHAQNEALFLLVITNDGWFGKSKLIEEHFAMSVFRAVEGRKAVAQVGNTGISGIVSPLGQVLEKTEAEKEAVISAPIPLSDQKTFYTKYGDIFVYFCLLLVLGYLIYSYLKRNTA